MIAAAVSFVSINCDPGWLDIFLPLVGFFKALALQCGTLRMCSRRSAVYQQPALR
jgi:hypothetical protein